MGFRVESLGFGGIFYFFWRMDIGFWSTVDDLGSTVFVYCLGFRVCFLWVGVSGFRVYGSGFKVMGCRVKG